MMLIFRGLIGVLAGFGVGALVAGGLVSIISGNTHDKGVEVVMTALFAGGPVGALIGLVVALFWRKRAKEAAPT